MWVLGFEAWRTRQERSNGKAGGCDFSSNALQQRVAQLQLTCPAVQWKEVGAGARGEGSGGCLPACLRCPS